MIRALVFLHGHDDTPASWADAARAMAPDGCAVEVPAAPIPTAAGATWFRADDDGAPVHADVHGALGALDDHLAAAARAYRAAPDEIALVGFSQGAAVALLHALTHRDTGGGPLGAVAVIAGWLPVVDTLPPDAPVGSVPRLLIAHGTADETVPLPLGRSAARLVARRGHDVTFVELDAGHDPGPFAAEIRSWLDSPQDVIPP